MGYDIVAIGAASAANRAGTPTLTWAELIDELEHER
jgi:hypothetical protein